MGGTDLVAVVEGEGAHFAVVGVGVLLGDVLKGAVGDVRVAGDALFILAPVCLTQHLIRHLPQAH